MVYREWITGTIRNTDTYQELLSTLPEKRSLSVGGMWGSARSAFIVSLFSDQTRPVLYICTDDDEAERAVEDMRAMGLESVHWFPGTGTTPYHQAVIDQSRESRRLDVIKRLLQNERLVVVISVETAFYHVTPREALEPYVLTFEKGQIITIEDTITSLVESGYTRVTEVADAGDFAVRGSILDIHYTTYRNPVRIDLFDNEIESIFQFETANQKRVAEIDSVVIPPHRELVYSAGEIPSILSRLNALDGADDVKNSIRESITDFRAFDGAHNYISLFYEKTAFHSYMDYPVVILNDSRSIINRFQGIYRKYRDLYGQSAFRHLPRPHYDSMLFTLEECSKEWTTRIDLDYLEDAQGGYDFKFSFSGIPAYLGNLELFKEDLQKMLDDSFKIVLGAKTEIQCERLLILFETFSPRDDRFDFHTNGFSILPVHLSDGFLSKEQKVFCINDFEIFGKRKKISQHFYTKRTERLDSFLDLAPGDYVVHLHHGIGRFIAIERVKSLGIEKDYLAIQYADNDKIFVPVEQLNFIQKYISSGLGKPKLDRIGAKGWSKTRERVRASIEELARELVKLYASRMKRKGFQFLPDTPWQKEFEARFEYEETRDQLLTIEEIKRDMESDKVTDRLICGDVGFGKTEVAMRAVFKAVMSGKQVAVLVPTTILAEQHYQTFCERMNDYPVSIDMLSRFRTTAQQKKTIRQLVNGEVDLVVGTHRLLSKDVTFKNLGLLVIDEEHRFGVKHKERLKQIRTNLDCISMTATPIPRTLHMSLANIREISVINTPPMDRQSVETYVMEFNDEIIIEGVTREMARDGQVFFLFNRIDTIHAMEKYLQRLVPSARIIVAHGRLAEDELENIIHSFINYEYDILLTTTIIESGIDIPRANTIFIDRADRYGLSQLYQLRGRVGRSEKKAYAYLFYNKDGALTEDAMKRLRVISEFSDLGSGFKIAMKDLEIRGAGNIFGPEQHGNILAVGFQLYCKLLAEAVREIAPEGLDVGDDADDLCLELNYTGYIPDSYIPDQKQKIEMYKKIAGVIHEDEIREIKTTLEDRFGPFPESIRTLLYLAEIRVTCKNIGVNEVRELPECLEIRFTRKASIDMSKLMQFIHVPDSGVFIKGSKPDSVFLSIKPGSTIEKKGERLMELLEKLRLDV
jgi:transcription-repair coupling factor (superfamily II helicase)